jgi:F5/8 type C domain
MDKEPQDFDDLFEPFELDDVPPPLPDRPEPRPHTPTQSVVSAVGERGTVTCPSCGSANPDYNRHCEQCGARLNQELLPVAPPPTLRTSPGGRALGVLAAVILVVALAALAFNILGGGGEAAEETSTTSSSTTIAVAARELFAASVEASSFLPGWEPENLIDGDPSTHWNDESLHGIGAWLTFRFSDPVSITEIELQNLVDEEKFKRNYKIQGYLITTDDLTVEFSGRLDNVDGSNPQRVPIASLATRELTIEVKSTYPAESAGDKPPFDELALLSVRFFGTDA